MRYVLMLCSILWAFLCGGCLIWMAYNGKDLMWFFWAFAGLAVLCGAMSVRVVACACAEEQRNRSSNEELQ